MIDESLLKVLACPLCDDHPPLALDGDHLICTRDGTRFPIEDGIPRLLPESAIPPAGKDAQ